jgi:ubiquinone biosynthesis protein
VPRGEQLARELFEAYLEQILANGFVHADPHPGNVLLTPAGRLSLIDLGMVTRLDPHLRHKLLTLLIALGSGRGHDVAEIAESVSEPLPGYDAAAFRSGVAELVGRHGDANVAEVGAGTVLTQLMQVCGEARLRLPAELSMVGKAMLNLDDVTRTLDPTFAPQELMPSYGEKLLRREMTDVHGLTGLLGPLVEMRELLETLPRRTQSIVDQVAAGEFTVEVDALDEQELLRGAQKIANRVTVGLLLAAMIVGAAMTMSVDTASTLFGYPSISIVFFLAAGVGGAALMGSILLGDRDSRRR